MRYQYFEDHDSYVIRDMEKDSAWIRCDVAISIER